MAGIWGTTPRASVRAECVRIGEPAVVSACVAVLSGADFDDDFLFVLAGPAARYVLDGGEGGVDGYWPKVWAARGLLYVWDDAAAGSIIDATTHESWRVREMAAKVIAAHGLDEAFDSLVSLLDDPVPRVRAAAARARRRLSTN